MKTDRNRQEDLQVSPASAPSRALLLEGIHPDAVAGLEKNGYAVETMARALDEEELIARIPGVELLGIRSKTSSLIVFRIVFTDISGNGLDIGGVDVNE